MAEERDLSSQLEELQRRAEKLDDKRRQLEEDLEQIEHEGRRLSDRTERGDTGPDLDHERSRLAERRELNLASQGETAREVEELRQQREELEEWLRNMRVGSRDNDLSPQ